VNTEFQCIALCNSGDLVDGGLAVPFDVVYQGQSCWAFAVRFEGQVQAYLNRCAHVAMEMDYQPNRFFDDSGQWIICATHGALYEPTTGRCVAGPCRRALVKIDLSEDGGVVRWHTSPHLQPLA
jgi:nitrite reductase/ring-hydroxylating ferredoxin subunit